MNVLAHGSATAPPRAMEHDALLGASARVGVSPRQLWAQSTPQSKALIALGSGAASVAGVATGLTYLLYARVLEAMAMGTVDGIDTVLVNYGWLLVAQFLGSCVQFGAWSRVASLYVAASEDKKSRQDESRERGSIEGLGACVRDACFGLTALIVGLQFGWEAILFVAIAAAFVVGFPIAVFAWARCCGSQETNSSEDPKRLEKELSSVWNHAVELRQLHAADVALTRVKRQLGYQERPGLKTFAMASFFFVFALPVVLAVLFVAWRIQETTTPGENVCVRIAVMLIASAMGLKLLQRAYSTFTKGDVLETIELDKTAPIAQQDEERAKNWILSLAGPARRLAPMLTIANVGMSLAVVASIASLAYTFAWLLRAPYTDHREVLSRALKHLGVILGCALVACLAFGAFIDVQAKIGRPVGNAVTLSVFGAKLKRDTPATSGITASSVLEGSMWIRMVTPSLLVPKHVSSIIEGVLVATVCFVVDPWFTLATLLACPFLSVHLWYGKLLFRNLLADTSAPLALLDALLRAVLDVADRAATIVLIYLQVAWIADGTSTLSSVLVVSYVIGMSAGFLHARRFDIGAFKRNEALSAAAKMCQFVEDARELSSASSSRGDVGPSATGDFSVEGPDVPYLSVQPGEVGELLVASPSAVASALLTGQELPEDLVAYIGGVKTTELTTSTLMDRCMLLSSDPAWLPGSTFDNIHLSAQLTMPEDIEAAAQAAGVDMQHLYDELALEQWEATPEIRESVAVARVLLRKPEILFVVDRDGSFKSWEKEVDFTIRPRQEQCRVVMIRSTMA